MISFLLLICGVSPSIPGFGYAGIYRICVAVNLLAFFYLLPMEKASEGLKSVIGAIIPHTLGIYCMHYLVGNLMSIVFEKMHIGINGLAFCVMLYVICFLVGTLISVIPSKHIQRLID